MSPQPPRPRPDESKPAFMQRCTVAVTDEGHTDQQARQICDKSFSQAELWIKMDSQRRRVLPASIRTIHESLAKAVADFKSRVADSSDRSQLMDRINVKRKPIHDGYEKLYMNVMPFFASRQYGRMRKSLQKQDPEDQIRDLWVQNAKRYVQYELEDRITGITDTTEREIGNMIGRALESGQSVDEIAANIDELGLDRIIKNRSRVIARTETINASNKGSLEGARATGLALEKVWIATLDGRQRPEHGAVNGDAVDMNDKFVVGGEELEYPGDPSASAANVVQCRCAVGYQEK